jgi:hypothetical protein
MVFQQLLLNVTRQHPFIIQIISIKCFTFSLIACYTELYSKFIMTQGEKRRDDFQLISIIIHTWCYVIAVPVILSIVQKTDFIRY